MNAPTEGDYFAHDDLTYPAAKRLAWTSHPSRRSALLAVLAEADWRKSTLHTAVFGYDVYSEDDPTSAAEWLADSSRLLQILSVAEAARATRQPFIVAECGDDRRTRHLAEAARATLRRYAAGRPRRRLVRHMCAIWAGMTGGQAVESAYCLGQRLPWWSR